jgi:prepilin-type N-terminal cleavage/methylation domain-containing protein
MRKQKGFSLIELLLVVAIIMIIAALAIPNFMRSRMAANEASAVSSLHNIEAAQVSYLSTYPPGYAVDLNTLGPGSATNITPSASNAMLLDIVLGCPTGIGITPCQKSGYKVYITTSGDAPTTYAVNGDPVSPGSSGNRHFFSDLSGVIRFNTTAIAGAGDQPLE